MQQRVAVSAECRRHPLQFFRRQLRFAVGVPNGPHRPFLWPAIHTPLVVPNSGLGDGEIFRTDFSGDGRTQDYVPGTKNGAFMRGIGPGGSAEDHQQLQPDGRGTADPSGSSTHQQWPVHAGATSSHRRRAQSLPAPVPGAVGLAWLKDVDMSRHWRYRIKETVTLEPGVGFYNILNFATFDLPPSVLSPYLTGAPGNIGGTNYAGTQNARVGAGIGVYGLGAPRVAEYTLKVTF